MILEHSEYCVSLRLTKIFQYEIIHHIPTSHVLRYLTTTLSYASGELYIFIDLSIEIARSVQVKFNGIRKLNDIHLHLFYLEFSVP